MPGLSLAMAANRRFNSLSIGGAWVATASLSVEIRISAPWPPTAGNCSGAKIRSISFSERPLTSARAPEVRISRRLRVFDRPGGTHTSRGVGARSSRVPSISSKIAHSSDRRTSSLAAGTAVRDAFSGDGMSSCNGTSARSCFISYPGSFILLHKGQRPCNRFQRPALGCDSVTPRDKCRRDHQSRSEQIAGKNAVARSGIDQGTEKSGTDDATDSRSDRVKHRDRERTDLQRKGFADGEICRARRWRSEKKDYHPCDSLGLRAQHADRKQIARKREQNARYAIGERNHRAASERIEQPAEQQRPKEIAGREGEDVT